MKVLQNVVATIAMVFLIIAMLIGSVWLAVYGDSDYSYYEREYEKYDVTSDLNMEMPDVMDVTDKMMAYLIGDREELSVMTDVDGSHQDFFNEQDRLHMADVKNLFIGGLLLGQILFAIAVILIIILILLKAKLVDVVPKGYFVGLGVCGTATVIVGALFASDFTKYFTIFHEIFFTNDLWLFDPATDYMIRMLPEGFFNDMLTRIGVCFIASLVIVAAIMVCWRKFQKKKD